MPSCSTTKIVPSGSEAASCFQQLKDAILETYGDLIAVFCDSRAFHEDSFSVLRALEKSLGHLPGITCLVCERFLDRFADEARDIRTHRAADMFTVAKLVFRTYQQHQNDEWTCSLAESHRSPVSGRDRRRREPPRSVRTVVERNTMILKALHIANFKAFAITQRMPFRPLTLIYGANRAGKSSILHALALAHHAIETGDLDTLRTRIGGEIIDLGGFRQYVHRRNREKQVELRFEIDPKQLSGTCSRAPSLGQGHRGGARDRRRNHQRAARSLWRSGSRNRLRRQLPDRALCGSKWMGHRCFP